VTAVYIRRVINGSFSRRSLNVRFQLRVYKQFTSNQFFEERRFIFEIRPCSMENLKPPLPNLFPCGCQPVVRRKMLVLAASMNYAPRNATLRLTRLVWILLVPWVRSWISEHLRRGVRVGWQSRSSPYPWSDDITPIPSSCAMGAIAVCYWILNARCRYLVYMLCTYAVLNVFITAS
jgi:hypothetical protein